MDNEKKCVSESKRKKANNGDSLMRYAMGVNI